MEILELYAELLLARAGLLDVRDKNLKDGITSGSDETGLEEAAASMIYAAPRLPRDVRELATVRGMLVDRFGKEFAIKASENEGGVVPSKVSDKLKVDAPKPELVQAYLEEIARTYGVDWPRRDEKLEDTRQEVDDEDEDSDGVGGGTKEQPILADGATQNVQTPKKNEKLELGSLKGAIPPSGLEGGAKSPVSVAPPGARTDNPSPKVRLPGGGEVKKVDQAKEESKKGGGNVVGGKVPTVDDLAKRFSALKR